MTFATLFAAGLSAAGVVWSGNASAAIIEFSNNSPITIPASGTSGPANPFPSTINVTGISNVVDVNVTLLGLSHTFSSDLEIILEGPGGQRVALMVDVGGGNDWTNDDVTFSDGAAAIIGSSPGSSGTFSPTSGPAVGCSIAQCTGAGELLSVFNGLDPDGIWSLYINDDTNLDSGSVAGGWRLTFDATRSGAPQIPEPGTLALLGLSLAVLAFARRKTAGV